MENTPNRQLKFIDAFSGCGGLSLGLAQAGLEGQFVIEKNESAFETFAANFLTKDSPYRFSWPKWLPKKPIGIEEMLESHYLKLASLAGKIDLLAGGPPCQGFSSAGRRRADDPRNQLFRSYIDLVNLIKPKAVLIENVRGFTIDFQRDGSSDNYSAKLIEELSKDYVVYDELLNLSQFGVPQNRIRYIVLAFRKEMSVEEPFDVLRNLIPGYLRALGLQVPVSSWAALSDLEVERCGTRTSSETPGFQEIKYKGPQTKYQKLMKSPFGAPGDLRLARHNKEISERFSEIIGLCHAEGRLNTSISNELRERFGLKKRALRVLDPDRPSPTITSMPDDLLHYREPRTLTVRENARLQSFPDWFKFEGKYTTGGERRKYEVPRFTQVANAVPPLAAQAIGLTIAKIFHDSDLPRSSRGSKRISKRTEVIA